MPTPEVIWVDGHGAEVIWDGLGEVYWEGGAPVFIESGFPPSGPTTLQNVIPSYLYVQYADDDNLQAFVAAYNAYAQTYIDCLNDLNLPIYTAGNIAGPLLDWVAAGIYGMTRPGLPTLGTPAKGPYNSFGFNSGLAYNGYIPATSQTYYATSDDIFRRIITWAFYKDDGRQFNARWLKRRIARFLNGVNGISYNVDQTYDVSVTLTGPYAATITLANTATSTVFKAAVEAGILELPFQILWTVTLV